RPTAGAQPPAPRTGQGPLVRSASREWHHVRAGLRKMARQDAVMVVVEARLLIEEIGHLGLAARGTQIAPAVDCVHLGRVARRIGLDDADGARIGPGRGLEIRERGREAAMVRMDAFAARAYPGAASDLMAKAGALVLCIKSEGLRAESMLISQRPQHLQRGAARAE